ncbi:MAG: DNA repair protein RecN [Nitrospirota bacterium]|nr:DNA repair protein RecN [Nitrospirota bacterium]
MLKELKIKNLAIIDNLSIRFDKGLNILSGETGAGKSIIVDALGLALGDRAQSDLIKSGEKEASVQAYFEPDDYSSFPDIGIDPSDGLVLRRTISSGGKSRAYINDTMVTLQTLSEFGKSLVDIHSQHEHQSLVRPEKQRMLLDSHGKLQTEREKVESLFRKTQALRDEFNKLKEQVRERARRLDLLRYQIDEINAASLNPGEKETLEEERNIAANLNKLKELTEASYSSLYSSEGACIEMLSIAISNLRDMRAIDNSMEDALNALESARPLIEDASIELRSRRDRYDADPGRLDTVEERLELIRKLERKYGDGIDAILQYRDSADEELKGLESSDERLTALEAELSSREEALMDAAGSLSEKRKRKALEIEELIKDNLRELAINSPGFRIDIRQETGDDGKYRVGPYGMDRIEFLFSANQGEQPKPLSKIISGGELSRVMLALKSILADVDNVPVLIFDEVDAGIGGKTAEGVGRKLDMISRRHQLLCITHLAQIASFGDFHLKIEKNDKNNSIQVEIKELTGKEREAEIARMLSGKITETSLRHAEELLGRAE